VETPCHSHEAGFWQDFDAGDLMVASWNYGITIMAPMQEKTLGWRLPLCMLGTNINAGDLFCSQGALEERHDGGVREGTKALNKQHFASICQHFLLG
jgi:hypothetical protein